MRRRSWQKKGKREGNWLTVHGRAEATGSNRMRCAKNRTRVGDRLCACDWLRSRGNNRARVGDRPRAGDRLRSRANNRALQ